MITSLFSHHPSFEDGEMDIAARNTKTASKQTYYTIRLLADRDRMQDAFRSYAYYRWLDDQLDTDLNSRLEKITLLSRQQELLEACYGGEKVDITYPEEQMLVELVKNDIEENSGLQTYLRDMMAVMAFDVERQGRVISQAELKQYSQLLSSAVTEYMFYFFGHCYQSHNSPNRYLAVQGAHITHMLRDLMDDVDIGYINIPAELLAEEQISLDQLHGQALRQWVAERVKLAHRYFEAGRKYIAGVKSKRCRLAGFAYLARFEWMLRVIEGDQYYLRRAYPERKSLKATMWMVWRVFTWWLNTYSVSRESQVPVAISEQYEET
jgi:phytoene/squalene synthetase